MVNYSQIPVFIPNRNRYTYFIRLLEWLEDVGQKNIFILDNDSTYPPLLEFYEKAKGRFKVVNQQGNCGSRCLWTNRINNSLITSPLIYSDPDILPIEECPKDTIEFLYYMAYESHINERKAGLGLKIDDIPEQYALKDMVWSWESQFWTNLIPFHYTRGVPCYRVPLDTTFALYRDASSITWSAVRTGFPYLARHLPWYIDSNNLSEEDTYYENHCEVTHSWGPKECYFDPAVEKYERERNAK